MIDAPRRAEIDAMEPADQAAALVAAGIYSSIEAARAGLVEHWKRRAQLSALEVAMAEHHEHLNAMPADIGYNYSSSMAWLRRANDLFLRLSKIQLAVGIDAADIVRRDLEDLQARYAAAMAEQHEQET